MYVVNKDIWMYREKILIKISAIIFLHDDFYLLANVSIKHIRVLLIPANVLLFARIRDWTNDIFKWFCFFFGASKGNF